jgi:prolipoprotein diacylglyceryltransferase
MLPIIHLGPLALPVPELVLLLGFWLGLELSERQAHHFRTAAAEVYNLALAGVAAGLAGARLVYAARFPAAFLANPLNLLALRPEMLDPLGGWVVAALAVVVTIKIRRLTFWSSLDALTTLLAVLAIMLGVAQLASGEAFGRPTHAPWAIELWGELRHPSQVYAILAALLTAAAVWPGSRIAGLSDQPGRAGLRFWAFLGLSAAARVFLETFRGDSLLLLGSFRQAQVTAWVVLALSLWQAGRRLNLELPADLEGEEIPA